MNQSIYDISCKGINNEDINLDQYRGKTMLIVNTASYCGFTPQYKGLEHLYRRYREYGLVVLGFPCNQFSEEPFDEERISKFCTNSYGVSFPMMSKIKVNGKNADPLFQFLKEKKPGFLNTQAIKWNFTKFLVDSRGEVVARFAPTMFPRYLDKRIQKLLDLKDLPTQCA